MYTSSILRCLGESQDATTGRSTDLPFVSHISRETSRPPVAQLLGHNRTFLRPKSSPRCTGMLAQPKFFTEMNLPSWHS